MFINAIALNSCFAAEYALEKKSAGRAVQSAVSYLQEYYQNKDNTELLGWSLISLYSTEEISFIYDRAQEFISNTLKNDQKLDDLITTDVTTDVVRMILALETVGLADKLSYDEKLAESQLVSGKFPDDLKYGGEELINAHIWAIIALQSAGIDDWDKESAINWLVKHQNADGGFNFFVGTNQSDVDVTASALIAFAMLGKNVNDPSVSLAIDYLHRQQLPDGGYCSWHTENAESTAMVIQALISLGLDPQDDAWKKQNKGLIDVLLSYQLSNGAFTHIKGAKANIIATEQALIALGDYINNSSIYFRLRNQNTTGFSDLDRGHWAYNSIIKLCQQRIFTGYPDGTFGPDKLLTRAEFAMALAKAMGDEVQEEWTSFTDVSRSYWAREAIGKCVSQGWLQGYENNCFFPERYLSGAELMAVILRVKNISVVPSQAGETWYQHYVDKARQLGLCYPDFKPDNLVTRAECAFMLGEVQD